MAYDQRIADLEAQVAELTKERDAAFVTIHTLSNSDTVRALTQGLKDAAEGRAISLECLEGNCKHAQERDALAEQNKALQRSHNALDAQVNDLLGDIVRDAELEMQISALTKERDALRAFAQEIIKLCAVGGIVWSLNDIPVKSVTRVLISHGLVEETETHYQPTPLLTGEDE